SIAAVAALEHRGQLGLLLEMALPEVLTDAVRLCGDDHLSAMLQGKINGDESRPAVLLPWELAARGCGIVDAARRLPADACQLAFERLSNLRGPTQRSSRSLRRQSGAKHSGRLVAI